MTETVRVPPTDIPWQIPDQRPEAEEWQLVSAASHELRTPLTALRTEVELALLGDRDAGELRSALRSAADEIRRLCRLADDMLLLAQADQGQLPLRPRPLEPRGLLAFAGALLAKASVMGGHVNRRPTVICAIASVAVIIALNGLILFQQFAA
jgi:signal transduction histidine kinase